LLVIKRIAEGAFGIILAVVLHTILGKVSAPLLIVFNAFSWVVLYFGLTRNEVFGAFMGTACGLLQDSFSLGIFGVGGLTKTLLGFGAGYISRKINVTPVTRTYIFALVLAAVELLLWKTLVLFLFRERFSAAGGLIFLQPPVTALFVTVAFQVHRRTEARRS
jgi:rod shape-determining protein MreD